MEPVPQSLVDDGVEDDGVGVGVGVGDGQSLLSVQYFRFELQQQ